MLMVTGQIADVENRRLLTKKLTSSGNVEYVRILRAQQVIDQFGPGLPEEGIRDDVEREAIRAKKQFSAMVLDEQNNPALRVVTPYVATKDFHGTDCLSCHAVAPETVNGAADILINMKPEFDRLQARTMTMLAGQVVLQILLIFAVAYCIKRLLRRPIDSIAESLHALALGDRTVDVKVDRKDEIGQLLEAIRTMVTSPRRVVSESDWRRFGGHGQHANAESNLNLSERAEDRQAICNNGRHHEAIDSDGQAKRGSCEAS